MSLALHIGAAALLVRPAAPGARVTAPVRDAAVLLAPAPVRTPAANSPARPAVPIPSPPAQKRLFVASARTALAAPAIEAPPDLLPSLPASPRDAQPSLPAQLSLPARPSLAGQSPLPTQPAAFGEFRAAAGSAAAEPAPAHAGFPTIAAREAERAGAPPGGTGFGAVHAAAPPPVRPPAERGPSARRPVAILDKPRPRYTELARARRIEGEVWLEVHFPAVGPPRALRLLRGLGYGLDEEARECVTRVQFRPAEQDGRAVDAIALLRVTFELADARERNEPARAPEDRPAARRNF